MAAPHQPPLADDYWMAAHDKPNGDALLSPKPLGIGLAAALLAELVMTNWLDVDDQGLMYLHPMAATHPPPEDVAMRGVLIPLLREAEAVAARYGDAPPPGMSADDWIQHLHAGEAQNLIEQRLGAAGQIRRENRGRLFRAARVVLVPVSGSTAGWPSARITTSLRDVGELAEQDLTLAGLIVATGLQSESFAGIGRRERDYLIRQTQAKMRPALRALVMRAETAVGRLVMTR